MAFFLYFSIIIVGIFYIFLSKDKKNSLLNLYVFFIPFFGLMYDIGISLTLDRVFSLFMLLVMFYDNSIYKISKKLITFLIFIFYSFMITLVLSQTLPDTVNLFPPLRGMYRYLGQIIMWSLQFIPVFFIVRYLKDREQIIKLFKVLILSCFILSLIGLFQYLFYHHFGYDILPVGVLQEDATRSGMFSFESLNIFRVSSLGGEPKHFAYSLSIVLPIIILLNYLKILKSKIIFMLIMLVNLILTFSTQGYIIFVLNMFIVFFLLWYFKGLKKKFFLYSLISVCAVVIFFVLNPFLFQLIKLRSIDRLLDPSVVGAHSIIEDFNEAVIEFIKENPYWSIIGVGLGNIHLYAQEYIPDYAWYMIDNVFVAKSGFLRLLSEVGLIGLFLFLISYLKPLVALSKLAKNYDLALFMVIVSIYSLIDFALTADGPTHIFLFLGISYCLQINYSCFSYNKEGLM